MVHEIGIAPRCYQDPHPPLYGAFAHSMRTIDMWAREGGKPIVMANQMEFCEALWGRYIKTAAEAGRDVKPEDAAAWGGVLMLGDSDEQIARIKDEHDWYWHNFFLPFGQGHLDPEENEDELYRFANEVIPRFSTKDADGTWV
jgi:alkanesulfonate monooxygenase SsuD/methylene tetrahydromethanopterin reductase-like flavin-dependent oxidoreductase (luciferase family)